MTQLEILTIAAPVVSGLVVLLTVFVTNYSDDRKAEAERRARSSSRNDNAAVPASAAE